MNKNTKRVLSAITTASLAGVLGGVAPAVAPAVLNLNGGVVHAAEKTHKVTIHYDLYDEPMFLLRSSDSSSKVVDVTPNQPLSDHIPETLPGGYVFYGASAHSGVGSEIANLSSRNDLFGNWTNIYVGYNLKLKKSRTNPSNAGTNNNQKPHKVTIIYCPYDGIPRETSSKVVDVTPNQPLSDHIPETLPGEYVFTSAIAKGSEGGVSLSSRNDLFGNETAFYVHYLPKSMISRTNPNNAGTNNNADTNAGANDNAGTNAGTNNNAGTNAGTNNNAGTNAGTNNNADTNAGANDNAGTNAGTNNNAGTNAGTNNNADTNAGINNNADTNAGTNNNADTNAGTNNNADTNAGTNNNADTEVKPGNNDNTGNNKPENKPAPENKPNNNSNAENTNTNNNVTPSEDIINNIFSNDASGVKVTLTDKTTAVKLSATPVEDKALVSSVLEKLNLPADNQIRILDLKLLDKDNHVVNSNAKRTVAIVLKEDEKDVAIYHIKDNGELKLIDSTTKDGVVTFEIDHFSKFAIVSNTNKPAINKVPEFNGGVNGTEPAVLEKPEFKVEKTNEGKFVVEEGKTETKEETKEEAKEGSLPNTGMTTSSTAALGLSLIALIGLAVRRKLNN